MTTNKQIIIDGKVKNCKILFECNSVDDLASFIMMKAGVEITPDNAPVFDNFDIRLIAEPRSPYGFSSLFKRNENIDEWEYMGFGHSGACSVVTALLKQLQRKTAECEGYFKQRNNILEECIRYQEEIGKLQKSQFCVAYEKDCHKVCKQQNCAIKNSYRYKQALDEIEEIANEPCIADTQEDCKSCDGNCEHKDILGIIRKAKGADNHG